MIIAYFTLLGEKSQSIDDIFTSDRSFFTLKGLFLVVIK